MITTKSITETKKLIKNAKKSNKIIGFVPTMGSLHAGHLSLIRRAKKESTYLTVSIFVNPFQFGPAEDFSQYPRSLKKDKELLKKNGVDLLFCPQADKMYPAGFSTSIKEDSLSSDLCGKSRSGHFQGVLTVVAKLFNIVSPDLAYFGQKDYQQALLIRKMVEDLNFSLKIKIAPIVRDKDKLALSSRNLYLSKTSRRQSRVLYQALSLAKAMLLKDKEKDPQKVIGAMRCLIKANSTASLDYCVIRNAEDLSKINKIEGKVFIGVAAFFAKTRLIDNMIIQTKKLKK